MARTTDDSLGVRTADSVLLIKARPWLDLVYGLRPSHNHGMVGQRFDSVSTDNNCSSLASADSFLAELLQVKARDVLDQYNRCRRKISISYAVGHSLRTKPPARHHAQAVDRMSLKGLGY